MLRHVQALWRKDRIMMLKVGDPAPEFTVQTHEGKELSLANLRGKKALLWFYPKADTPG
jgi:peroxiredoxin Q/BCP